MSLYSFSHCSLFPDLYPRLTHIWDIHLDLCYHLSESHSMTKSVSIPWTDYHFIVFFTFLHHWKWPNITSPPGLIMEYPSLPLLSLHSFVEYRRDTTKMMATPCWYIAVLVWFRQAPLSCLNSMLEKVKGWSCKCIGVPVQKGFDGTITGTLHEHSLYVCDLVKLRVHTCMQAQYIFMHLMSSSLVVDRLGWGLRWTAWGRPSLERTPLALLSHSRLILKYRTFSRPQPALVIVQ